MDGYIGQIILFAGNFAPKGWVFCHGQMLAINANAALFSVIGTTYGGDGKTTFAVPDLRGRVPIGVGNGAGLSQRALGEMLGSESVTLVAANLPTHTHALEVAGGGRGTQTGIATKRAAELSDNTTAIQPASGSSTPVGVMQPSLGLNYIMCTQGMFPVRE